MPGLPEVKTSEAIGTLQDWMANYRACCWQRQRRTCTCAQEAGGPAITRKLAESHARVPATLPASHPLPGLTRHAGDREADREKYCNQGRSQVGQICGYLWHNAATFAGPGGFTELAGHLGLLSSPDWAPRGLRPDMAFRASHSDAPSALPA